MESIGQELGPAPVLYGSSASLIWWTCQLVKAEISRNDFFSWDFNIAELNTGRSAKMIV